MHVRCLGISLLLAASLFGCAPFRVSDTIAHPDDSEPSDGALDLYYRSYEMFLDRTFPLDISVLAVQVYKDVPRDVPEDLELSFSFQYAQPSGALEAHVLIADQVPVVSQVYRLSTESSISDPITLLAQLRLVERTVTLKACPAITSILQSWQPSWLTTSPLSFSEISENTTIRLHPRVVRIAVRATNDRFVKLETTDSADPAFRWGIEAASQIRQCVLELPAA